MTHAMTRWDYSNTRRLFVYGTLMDADTFVRIVGQRYTVVPEGQEPPNNTLFAIKAVLENTPQWKTRERSALAMHRPGEKIEGLLIFRVTDAMLKLLDNYEGGHYTRRSVTVSSSVGELEAECYLALRDIPPRG